MLLGDYLGTGALLALGLWWLLLPESAVRVYRRLSPVHMAELKPIVVRVSGLIWIIVILVFAVLSSKRFL